MAQTSSTRPVDRSEKITRARCHAKTALASVARTCLVRPRLSVSNPRLLIGWQTHAVNSQPTPLLLFGGIHPRVLSQQIHSHEGVAVIKERAPQPGYAINLRAMPCGGNKEPSRRARAGAKSHPAASGRYACFRIMRPCWNPLKSEHSKEKLPEARTVGRDDSPSHRMPGHVHAHWHFVFDRDS